MNVKIRVIPRASRIKVEQLADMSLKVHLTRPASDGQANAQLVTILADHFKVKKYQVEIVKGATSHHKEIRISDG